MQMDILENCDKNWIPAENSLFDCLVINLCPHIQQVLILARLRMPLPPHSERHNNIMILEQVLFG